MRGLPGELARELRQLPIQHARCCVSVGRPQEEQAAGAKPSDQAVKDKLGITDAVQKH
jgi:hypothetical protein